MVFRDLFDFIGGDVHIMDFVADFIAPLQGFGSRGRVSPRLALSSLTLGKFNLGYGYVTPAG